jgi:hypothetical protein
MGDQRDLPWPGIGLAISDAVSHHFGWRCEADDDHAINRESVDHALQLEWRLRRRCHQEQAAASGLL